MAVTSSTLAAICVAIQRTGLIVNQRSGFIQTTNGTTLANAGSGLSIDGLSLKGGGFVYGVVGNTNGYQIILGSPATAESAGLVDSVLNGLKPWLDTINGGVKKSSLLVPHGSDLD